MDWIVLFFFFSISPHAPFIHRNGTKDASTTEAIYGLGGRSDAEHSVDAILRPFPAQTLQRTELSQHTLFIYAFGFDVTPVHLHHCQFGTEHQRSQ